jgi:HEPN domain-containing protein
LCYHAQQAAEKALKAVLVCRGRVIPRTHSIAHLFYLVGQAKPVPRRLLGATALTPYGTFFRYPTDSHAELTVRHRRTAVARASRVVVWAATAIGCESDPRRRARTRQEGRRT